MTRQDLLRFAPALWVLESSFWGTAFPDSFRNVLVYDDECKIKSVVVKKRGNNRSEENMAHVRFRSRQHQAPPRVSALQHSCGHAPQNQRGQCRILYTLTSRWLLTPAPIKVVLVPAWIPHKRLTSWEGTGWQEAAMVNLELQSNWSTHALTVRAGGKQGVVHSLTSESDDVLDLGWWSGVEGNRKVMRLCESIESRARNAKGQVKNRYFEMVEGSL